MQTVPVSQPYYTVCAGKQKNKEKYPRLRHLRLGNGLCGGNTSNLIRMRKMLRTSSWAQSLIGAGVLDEHRARKCLGLRSVCRLAWRGGRERGTEEGRERLGKDEEGGHREVSVLHGMKCVLRDLARFLLIGVRESI